jgi:hypothetical protein
MFGNSLCQIVKSTLPNSQVTVAKSAFQSCQFHIAILLFGYFAKWQSPLHQLNCPNELQDAHKSQNFWAVSSLNFFSSLRKLLLAKIRLPPFFFSPHAAAKGSP